MPPTEKTSEPDLPPDLPVISDPLLRKAGGWYRVMACRSCRHTWERKLLPGRPPSVCPDCRARSTPPINRKTGRAKRKKRHLVRVRPPSPGKESVE